MNRVLLLLLLLLLGVVTQEHGIGMCTDQNKRHTTREQHTAFELRSEFQPVVHLTTLTHYGGVARIRWNRDGQAHKGVARPAFACSSVVQRSLVISLWTTGCFVPTTNQNQVAVGCYGQFVLAPCVCVCSPPLPRCVCVQSLLFEI